ncbi:MAG TPA: cytochrome c3 family protein [Candidatus Cybelea sp.]|nr:cytochrome c3 family protein [Candidatus Cybelea sp.]
MNILISYLTRKRRGGLARKDEIVSTDILRLGRGADCNLHLPDQRILLSHAQIVDRPGGYFIEALGPGDLRVNGIATQAARLAQDDRISIGPYELQVVGGEGQDFGLTVELVRPLGDDLAQLRARSRTSLRRVAMSVRGWSWVLASAVLLLFLALPVVAHFVHPVGVKSALMSGSGGGSPLSRADSVWITGALSGPHRFFGDNCGACHQVAFAKVPNEACLTCHTNVRHHADTAKFAFADIAGRNCESCHREHNGPEPIVLRDQAFCVSCHGDLKSRSPAVTVGNVTDFGRDHPQFRPRVIQDAATGAVQRVSLDADAKAQEHSGLKFPHDKHLKPEGLRSPDKGMVKLDCASCHKPDAAGVGFLPIRMSVDCQGCHALRFDGRAPDRELPHGKPVEAMRVLQDFYAGLALRGEVQDQNAPEVTRRRPGQPLAESERKEALAWATSRAKEQADLVIGKALCAGCHTVNQGADGTWAVAPVKLADRWLPAGAFVHNKHASVSCDTCHDARKSDAATDVLLPRVQTCQNCHGGEAAAGKVPSTCISCHSFHRPDMAPLATQKSADAK